MSRVVAITGVCSEAAVATVHEFARRGDTLALMSRTPDAVDRGVALVERLGGRALGVVLDTTDPDAVETAVARLEVELGPVEVWVNTSDDPGERCFDQLDPDELRRVTELCYLGHVHATMTVLERMKARGHGTIVHVASALSARGCAGRGARPPPLRGRWCARPEPVGEASRAAAPSSVAPGSRQGSRRPSADGWPADRSPPPVSAAGRIIGSWTAANPPPAPTARQPSASSVSSSRPRTTTRPCTSSVTSSGCPRSPPSPRAVTTGSPSSMPAGPRSSWRARPTKRVIDEVEAGGSPSPAIRLAFEVDDSAAATDRLEAAGAHVVARPVLTPWRSLNARLDAPAGLQVTLFQETETLEERSAREGFGTETGRD
jgi:NAD(P)-dependent dehydrogenase (short-subunit alcohol dehydrogenase family)